MGGMTNATPNPSHAGLLKAIQYAGDTQSGLARLLGTSQPLVHKWLSSKNPLAPEHCALIERATNGSVTRRELRPDDWHLIWPELVDMTEAVKASDDVQPPVGGKSIDVDSTEGGPHATIIFK